MFKTNSYIQDKALYIGRMLKELCYSLFLALTLKFEITNREYKIDPCSAS